MTGRAQPRRNNKPSINYRYNPHGGAIFDLVDVTREDYAPISHDTSKKPANQVESRSSVLSTADIISGISQLWNFATSSLPVSCHRTSTQNKDDSLQKVNKFYYPAEKGNIIASISSEGQDVSVNLKDNSHISTTVNVQKDLDYLSVVKKLASFNCCSESHNYHHLLRCLRTNSNKTVLSYHEKSISSVTISYGLQNIYGWMSSTEHDDKITDYCCNAVKIASVEISDSDNTSRLDDGLPTITDACHNQLVETRESLSRKNANNLTKTSTDVSSLCSDYHLNPMEDLMANNRGSIVPTYSESRHEKVDEFRELKESQESQSDNQEKAGLQIFIYKPQFGIAKQEHAFAGAFAGIFVSLCLHPMDTVKTVVQSYPTDQRSIQYIGKSIISERGLSGLYRGIASNIASSAPISAIYTFSYESVKGALLPLFAKEYHSLAHCVAGGCASVATSFVFTPSERIKQQMQVGSHYHSCWNALLGIVGKGGFSSLYNGWGAVLCRNVPHSIIKFYTYESLKNWLFSSDQQHAQLTTISTLLCGGLAGSTAALFTTPFDVVKTRLQTQIPGCINRYHGVFNTLKDIAQHEGPKGLYRGLTPRLAMYMTQGALFFASYESFKKLFSLEAATQPESSLKGS